MRIRPMDLVDVLAYLVVLGLFIQLFPQVISESFLVALLTSVVLKVVLELVLWVKKRIVSRIRGAQRRSIRILNVAVLLLVLPGSKLIVLELIDFLFGGAVHLGGFFQVSALIVALLLARGGIRRLIADPAGPAGGDDESSVR
ncbi:MULTISPECIES: hypothetical protein [unclassified Microbacterium]|uniref:hypothetical protein n=1 Tax=unclassified Microbacterium TaxID=2609290 RepID=UPI00214A9AF9|nr:MULTISPECIES: hypothetical protein [unclassified Microbacterium]MCR2809944.1 hypothetical protein [Microbacterium sp. zg.B185]WIM17751.1 hypothetical protein QNO12_08945 [Microbacterium sp. zg-B185]